MTVQAFPAFLKKTGLAIALCAATLAAPNMAEARTSVAATGCLGGAATGATTGILWSIITGGLYLPVLFLEIGIGCAAGAAGAAVTN